MRKILKGIGRHLTVAALFSVAINLLFLVSPLYMLQIYDRVLTTGSLSTLIFLTALALFLMVSFLFAEAGRKRVLARVGEVLGVSVGPQAVRYGLSDVQKSPQKIPGALQGLDRIKQLFTQGTVAVLFDLPFVPFFLAILYAVHLWLGILATLGAAVLVSVAIATELITREPLKEVRERNAKASVDLQSLVRRRDAVISMGMIDRLTARWESLSFGASKASLAAGMPATYLAATTKALRTALQILVLGLGAYLAIRGDISSGAIVAGSIIMGRALAPIDQIVNAWRPIIAAQQALVDLDNRFDQQTEDNVSDFAAPRPSPQLRLENTLVGIPGATEPLLPPLNLNFGTGRFVGIIGASGSGKSSLLRTLAGVWPPGRGSVKLGERDLSTWPPSDRGKHLGFLPQESELLRGTVFENIGRFSDAPTDDVFEISKAIGVHDLIQGFSSGYETFIDGSGEALSLGQRQAVGLARAFFGDPALILLDEPTSHLDAETTGRFIAFLADRSAVPSAERSHTMFIATHDLRLLRVVDDILMIKERRVALTTRDEYFAKALGAKKQDLSLAGHPSGRLQQ